MKQVLSAIAFAALLGFGYAGTASAAGPASAMASAMDNFPISASQQDAPRILRVQEGPPSFQDMLRRRNGERHDFRERDRERHNFRERNRDREWRNRDRDRHHWRGRDRWEPRRYGPNFGIYIEPRVYPRYAEPRRIYRLSGAHYRWCEARYRSYRVRDNTFQPYNGPRRQCISPYS